MEGDGQKCVVEEGLAHEAPIKLKKLSLLVGIEATTLSQAITFNPLYPSLEEP